MKTVIHSIISAVAISYMPLQKLNCTDIRQSYTDAFYEDVFIIVMSLFSLSRGKAVRNSFYGIKKKKR